MAVFLVVFSLLSILMVLVLVPFSMELVAPSADMAESRVRMRGVGAPGALTAWLVPRFLDDRSPRRVWGIAYAACWVGILISAGWAARNLGASAAESSNERSLPNWAALVIVVGGFWAVHLGIILFARAIVRASQRRTEDLPEVPTSQWNLGTDIDGDRGHHPSPGELPDEPDSAHAAEHEVPSGPEAGDSDSAASAPLKEARPALGTRIKHAVQWIGMVAAALVLIAIAEAIPLLKTFEAALRAHQKTWLIVTIAIAAMSFLVFMGSIISLVLERGQPQTRDDIEQAMARTTFPATGTVIRRSAYSVTGEAHGVEAHEGWTLREMKAAWRAGLWRHDRTWRRRFRITAAAAGLCLGGFGIVFVLAPVGIKAIVAGAVGYVVVRITWAWIRTGRMQAR